MKVVGTIKIISPSVEKQGQWLANALLKAMACWDHKDLLILQERKADG